MLAAVREQLTAASNEKNHSNILRFVKLYAPLGAKVLGCPTLPGSSKVNNMQALVNSPMCQTHLQEEGVEWFIRYLCNLVEVRANEEYNTLVEGTGRNVLGQAELHYIIAANCSLRHADDHPDFAGALTSLLRDLGAAVQENEVFIFQAFSKEDFLQVGAAMCFLGRHLCLCSRYFGAYFRAYPDLATDDSDEGRVSRSWTACTHSVIEVEHGCCSVSFATGAWNKLSRTSAATGL